VLFRSVSCLVSMFADERCLFQYLEAMEVRPRFPMPCHHRRNGSGTVYIRIDKFRIVGLQAKYNL
jgi:hypothetical protein